MLGLVKVGLVPLLSALHLTQQRAVTIDAFESAGNWTMRTSEGVSLRSVADSGYRGRSMRLDFDFGTTSSGIAAARRAVNLTLPATFQVTFRARAKGLAPSIQLRLLDQAGEVVLSAHAPSDSARSWSEVILRKRQFAQSRGGRPADVQRVAAIEIAITDGGSGARGSFWVDELQLLPRDPDLPYSLTPRVVASSALPGFEPTFAIDKDAASGWRSGTPDTTTAAPPPQRPSSRRNAPPPPPIAMPNGAQALAIDFLRPREFGALVVDWEPGRHATAYTVDLSANGMEWSTRYQVALGNGGRDYIPLPAADARFVRLVMTDSAGAGFGIREISVAPVEWTTSANAFFTALAADAPRGSYPKYLSGTASHWTIAGSDAGEAEVLVGEEGLVETRPGGASIEPFVYIDDTLFTWRDVQITHSLANGRFPEPSVTWTRGDWTLTLEPVVAGSSADSSIAHVQYRVANRGRARRTIRLYLAMRPFQVIAPGQLASRIGGFTPIRELSAESQLVRVNGVPAIVSITPSVGFGAVPFDQGNVVDYLRGGQLPPSPNVSDRAGYASGALAYEAQVDSGNALVVEVAIPLNDASVPVALSQRGAASRAPRDRSADTRRAWRDAIERVAIEVPPTADRVVSSLYANVGYILVNRDRGWPRVGSRAAPTTRLDDGAAQAIALLRLGRADVARDLLDRFARSQLANGSIPCCVSDRGTDPVSQHDSHGTFISLVAEYWRHTRDRETVDRLWPNVARAAVHLDSLRRRQLTAEYQTADKRVFFGILPAAPTRDLTRPLHAYRDDFVALRGLTDAVELAQALSRPEEIQIAATRDSLRRDLHASIQLAMVQRGIDVLPGSAELGDFSPKTTFTALATGVERTSLPETVARGFDRTVERYWAELTGRIAATASWDAFSAAELQSIGAFVRLGLRERALAALDFFLKHQRPDGWLMWPDSIRRDSTLGTTGDMPNSSAGAAFIGAVLDMFAYERDADSSLVVAAGVPEAWVTERPGVTVRRLSTQYGQLTYTMRRETNAVRISMQAGLRMPPGGIVVHSPFATPARQSLVNGIATPTTSLGAVVVRALPAEVVFRH